MTYKGESIDGNGTVPHFSATPIELSKAKAEAFVACPHASLQNFDPGADANACGARKTSTFPSSRQLARPRSRSISVTRSSPARCSSQMPISRR